MYYIKFVHSNPNVTITGGLDLSYLNNLNLKANEVIYYIITYIWGIALFLP